MIFKNFVPTFNKTHCISSSSSVS